MDVSGPSWSNPLKLARVLFIRLLLICLTGTVGSAWGQQLTPLDTLYSGKSLGLGMRVVLKPIQLWQHFSYSQSFMNCQFESSCSNFMAEAIQEKGLIRGAIAGTDRIVRCNPAAHHYHIQNPNSQFHFDGRLIDPLEWAAEPEPGKSPVLAVALSIVPGLGRTYAGRPIDGLFSLLLVASFANNAYQHNLEGNSFRVGLNTAFMSLFWVADIYGAYRSAKMTPAQ